jgi:hypothetical protein
VYVPWSFTIADSDGVKKATVSYTLKDDTGATFLTGTVQLSPSGGAWAAIRPTSMGTRTRIRSTRLSWTLTSTDAYGGTSKVSKTKGLLIRLN